MPLDTERGYNVTLPSGSLGLTRPVLFEGHGFVISPLDTGDRVGGAVEFAGLKAAPNYARVDALIARARRFLPEGRFEGGTRWMGFRPSIPDSLPVIGPSRRSPRVLHAFGHGHYGLTQAAITADIVTAQVMGLPTPLSPAPFSAQRF
nr:FAD-binding oxidoreductase [Elstera litoralis]